jgi:hypothetical protein
MANTSRAELVKLSQRIYKEWYPKTVLVQSCDRSFEGELNLETRELDIPVYHDLTIHQTTIKERELKPAAIEFMKSSTKRVSIDKGRYSHWGTTKLNKLVERLSQEESEIRKKLVEKWANEAEKELAEYCAFSLGAAQTINIPTILSWSTTGYLDKDNIFKVLDILKAKVIEKNMSPGDFQLFVSEQFETVLRDTKIQLSSLDANETFRTGFVGKVNGVDVRKIEVSSITTRDTGTSLVTAEYAIWKSRDGIQYVVPYKDTITYEIQPTEVLLGGTGYQTVEYYDFFNLYPTRLYRVPLYYEANPTLPTAS